MIADRFWCIFCMVSFRRRVRIGFGVLHATQLIGHAACLNKSERIFKIG